MVVFALEIRLTVITWFDHFPKVKKMVRQLPKAVMTSGLSVIEPKWGDLQRFKLLGDYNLFSPIGVDNNIISLNNAQFILAQENRLPKKIFRR